MTPSITDNTNTIAAIETRDGEFTTLRYGIRIPASEPGVLLVLQFLAQERRKKSKTFCSRKRVQYGTAMLSRLSTSADNALAGTICGFLSSVDCFSLSIVNHEMNRWLKNGYFQHLNAFESSSDKINADLVCQLGASCLRVKTVSFTNCVNVDNECLMRLGQFNILNKLSIISNENISDIGVRNLYSLRTLVSLDLSFCDNITDNSFTPNASKSWPHLKSLTLQNCWQITDGIFQFICQTKMEYLNLKNCDITNHGVQKLHDATTLKHLELCGDDGKSKITDLSFINFNRMCKLSHLSLTFNKSICGTGFSVMVDCMNLIHLDLTECNGIKDDCFYYLNKFRNLEHLNLSRCCKLDGTGFKHCSQLKKLHHLNLTLCVNIKNSMFVHLQRFSALHELILVGCGQLTDVGLQALQPLSIEKLDLFLCHQVTDQGLEAIKGLPITNLALSNCRLITDIGMKPVSEIKTLNHLILANCSRITDVGLKRISTLPNLVRLVLVECSLITDLGLRYVSDISTLGHLNLSGCRQITDKGASWLAKLSNLEYLDASGSNISDVAIVYFRSLKRLRCLILAECCHLTDSSLRFMQQLPCLRDLDLFDCDEISSTAVQQLRSLQLEIRF